MFAVESVDRDYNLNRLERCLAIAKDGNIKPAIVLNKIDLIPQAELNFKITQINKRFNDMLRGSEILPEARIPAVADVVDAICSDRPYRPSLGLDQALEEITNFKGILYEAAVVDACMHVYEEWTAVISLKGSLSSGPHLDS